MMVLSTNIPVMMVDFNYELQTLALCQHIRLSKPDRQHQKSGNVRIANHTTSINT